MKKRNMVVTVAFGDGAADQGVFYESLNFAALKNLPVVFVCENNRYATHAHQTQRQARDNIFERARVFGMPGERVDGNDVVEVYRCFREAVRSARRGRGPALIECMTYRWLEHVGPHDDWDLGYRSRAEVQRWKRRCPVRMFGDFLEKKKIIDDRLLRRGGERIEQRIHNAVARAQKSAFPPGKELCSDVYCD